MKVVHPPLSSLDVTKFVTQFIYFYFELSLLINLPPNAHLLGKPWENIILFGQALLPYVYNLARVRVTQQWRELVLGTTALQDEVVKIIQEVLWVACADGVADLELLFARFASKHFVDLQVLLIHSKVLWIHQVLRVHAVMHRTLSIKIACVHFIKYLIIW